MDNSPTNPSIIVVDRATAANGSVHYAVNGRVPLPGIGLQMGLTHDHTSLGVFRARNVVVNDVDVNSR